jgi:delta 1-pyrroline-5-carboxylate dehydrogenase
MNTTTRIKWTGEAGTVYSARREVGAVVCVGAYAGLGAWEAWSGSGRLLGRFPSVDWAVQAVLRAA